MPLEKGSNVNPSYNVQRDEINVNEVAEKRPLLTTKPRCYKNFDSDTGEEKPPEE